MAKPKKPKAKSKRKQQPKAKPNPILDTARTLAEQAYARPIQRIEGAVTGARQHGAVGGGMDQAFDRSRDAIGEFQRAHQAFTDAHVTDAENFGQFGVTATAGLGEEQVARAQADAALYGQTAAAAEEAAKRQGAAGLSQQSGGAGVAGMLRSQGMAQSSLATSLGAANETRRGEQRKLVGDRERDLLFELAELMSERGGKEVEIATDMARDQRDFELAMSTLDQRNEDSLRDYEATMAGIGEQRRQADIRFEDADLDRSSREGIAADNRAAADRRAREGRQPTARELAMYDRDGDGRLEPGEAYEVVGGGGSDRGEHVFVGREGRPFRTTREGRTQFVNRRRALDSMFSAISQGRAQNSDELERLTSMNSIDDRLFDFAADYVRRKAGRDGRMGTRDDARHPIDRKWLAVLKDYFDMAGELPADIADMVMPPRRR